MKLKYSDIYNITNQPNESGRIGDLSRKDFKGKVECNEGYGGFPTIKSCTFDEEREGAGSRSGLLQYYNRAVELKGCYPNQDINNADGKCGDYINDFELMCRMIHNVKLQT